MSRSKSVGSWFGVCFGILVCVLCGGGIGVVLVAQLPFKIPAAEALVAASAALGALVGAVIGISRDVRGAMRDAFPPRRGPEADYDDPTC